MIPFNFNNTDSKKTKSDVLDTVILLVKDEFTPVCDNFLDRIFNVVANAGNIKKHKVKYKKLKPKKTQNNCEKNENVSNCGI